MSHAKTRLLEATTNQQAPWLCRICCQIGTTDTRWFIRTEKSPLAIYIHHPDLHSLKTSAFQGCRMCQFLLWTLRNSDDAHDVPTTSGDIVESSEITVSTELQVADQMGLIQKHSHELSATIAYASPTSWTIAHVLSDNSFLKDIRVKGLHLLSELCGHGRVVLTGIPWTNHLPSDLHAVVLYPFGALGIQEFHKPFITGLPFELASGLGDPLEPLANAWTTSPTLFDDNLLHRIRGWRDYCLSHHSKCRGMRGQQPLPRRVIEIPLGVAVDTVRLRDTRGKSGSYAALSYCWGTCPQKKTTKSTIQEHFAGIRVSSLPATIQDAVRLCQALEIPYLWVDSLCILQDDSQDWGQEASEMASIYGRSALTITTPHNSQCDQSFSTPDIREREDSSWPRLPWKHFRGENTVSGSVTVRPRVLSTSGDPFPLSNGKTDSPWMNRGWTLQEWLLSPRVLHCGRERVWDCYETWHTESRLTWSSTFASALNDTENVRDGLASHIFARMARLDPHIRGGGLDTHWARLVEDFTSRSLSREMDKMPAIAGLAAKFMEHSHAKAPGARYLAGLWHYKGINPFEGRTYPTSQIPLGLLWRRSGPEFMRSPAAYRAPSWSWAALDGPVDSFHIHWPLNYVSDTVKAFKVVKLLKVETATCAYDPPGSCSLVRTGWIIATGLLKPAYIRTSLDATQLHSGHTDGYYRTCVRLGTRQDREETYWFGIFDQSLENTGIRYVERSLYLLHVATVTHFGHGPEVLNHALVVEKIGSFDNVGCLRRMGVAYYSSVENDGASGGFLGSATEWSDRHMLKDWETCQVRLI